jgi:lysophospholipase L1-like esterase
MTSDRLKCLITGDSFVKRLQDYLHNDMNLSTYMIRGTEVEMTGFPGIGVRRLSQHITHVPYNMYDVVVINCGSNDLCKLFFTPERLVDELLWLANVLINDCGVREVLITEILQRTRYSHRHFEVTLQEYNERVRIANGFLHTRCTGRVHFWKHDHRVRRQSSVCADGVHLTPYGVQQFHRSILRALSSFL